VGETCREDMVGCWEEFWKYVGRAQHPNTVDVYCFGDYRNFVVIYELSSVFGGKGG
jgi:hypothetical protein